MQINFRNKKNKDTQTKNMTKKKQNKKLFKIKDINKNMLKIQLKKMQKEVNPPKIKRLNNQKNKKKRNFKVK